MSNFSEIQRCRICGNTDLIPILDLGELALTGIFPKNKDQEITSAPLELVKCREDGSGKYCGLVQLRHSFDLNEMYGENYGYRSGLNHSMVEHLHRKVRKILRMLSLSPGDLVIDIGSNDSTLLQAYPDKLLLVGIDPTGKKFKKYYPEHIQLIPDFFSSEALSSRFGKKKAKIITSIAMFYDLEAPLEFVDEIYRVLSDDGIWVFEQSYLPMMLQTNSYDTICHEHLEYYGLKQIKWILDKVGMKIIDVETNSVNGGSFSVVAAKRISKFSENRKAVVSHLDYEASCCLDDVDPYIEFKSRVYEHRDKLNELLSKVKREGQTIFGCGASTKGNVILQFCNITSDDIPFISEVNEDKFGAFTPGSKIPIISEEEARELRPDYFLVLPWHFRDGIVKRESAFLKKGGKLVFPLPVIEIVSDDNTEFHG